MAVCEKCNYEFQEHDAVCPSCVERRGADSAEAKVARLQSVLRDLLVWAEWIQARRGAPRMNEPCTGAITAARAVLRDGR